MERYFNINYEFDREVVHNKIAEQVQRQDKGYICVADGVILNIANRNKSYLKVLDNAMFAICDSSYVPLYLKWLYGLHHKQYCGVRFLKMSLKRDVFEWHSSVRQERFLMDCNIT